MLATGTPRFFQDQALVAARLSIWNKKFAAALARVQGTTLQKIAASDEGYLVLNVYKPGDDRTSVLVSVRKNEPGIECSLSKPPSQQKPNSIVQVARKYLVGRRVMVAYASLAPVAVVLEFDSIPENSDLTPEEQDNAPDCLVLDLESRPPRVSVAKKYAEVPLRYKQVAEHFAPFQDFFESVCEWSLDATKTKRRACFDEPLLSYCILYSRPVLIDKPAEKNVETELPSGEEGAVKKAPESLLENTSLRAATGVEPRSATGPETRAEFKGEDVFAEVQKQAKVLAATVAPNAELTLTQALSLIPTHVRRACRTRLQFLERRLQRQQADLPVPEEMERLRKRAEALKTYLYLWPQGSSTWYVPPQIIEETGLPMMLKLRQGQKPGDLLDLGFLEIEKLKRRRSELQVRLAESDKALQDFSRRVLEAGNDLKVAAQAAAEAKADLLEGRVQSRGPKGTLGQAPESALFLCQTLEISWTTGGQKARVEDAKRDKRLPYRSYTASTGEFIRVAKSAADGDAMLKMMPSHHTWVHVITGEGSHVWLEKPKKIKPSAQAVREAAILAVHHSKQGRGQSADVYVATRGDVEKKKDLAPGKVIVRRSGNMLMRYTDEELQKILATYQ